MKSGIAGLLLVAGLIAIGISVKLHYYPAAEEVWSESEVKEIDQLSLDLHSATRNADEPASAKETREKRLKELYARQDDAISSSRTLTSGLWWGGFLSCLAGIGLSIAAKKKPQSFKSLPSEAEEAVADAAPPKPTKALGPESLGPENWK